MNIPSLYRLTISLRSNPHHPSQTTVQPAAAFAPKSLSFRSGSSACFPISHTYQYSITATFIRASSSSFSPPSLLHASKSTLESETVPELKDRLRALGLKVGGRKSELIERLLSAYHTPDASIESSAVNKPKASSRTISSRSTSKSKMAKSQNDAPASTVTHAPASLIPSWFNPERSRLLTPNALEPAAKAGVAGECIVYWMQRDVRTVDNWALLFAQRQAQQCGLPLRVIYALPPPPQEANASNDEEKGDMPPLVADMCMTERHGQFLLDGLKIVETELATKEVPFDVLQPTDRSQVGQCVYDHATTPTTRALMVITDFSPLRLPRTWIEDQAAPLFDAKGVPVYSVDAHNIVPVWHASPKREVGARTLRPKINMLLPEFLTHFADFEGNDHLTKGLPKLTKVDWDKATEYLQMDPSVKACEWAQAGHEAAMTRFTEFCQSKSGNGLKNFDAARNDPNHDDVCSNLSPWINYGQVSFQRLALEVRAFKKYSTGTAAYIEEGVVRRELSDNYVYYSRDEYDSLDAAAGWARESLDLHEADKREYLYTLEEFDKAQTHDDLWNAAQLQLVREGGMHGFLRMYWAKKILEWTPNAAVALRTGLYFNDRYALDGNDPNGFVGVGWSVMGIHDMGWKERPIFGKIRFMNYNGCKRKFKIPSFVAKYKGAAANADAAIKKHEAAKKGTKRKAPA